MRSLIILALVASLASCGGGGSDTPGESFSPSPTVVALAADQLVFDSTRLSVNREIYVMKKDGTAITRLTNDSAYEHWWPRISPDRKKILFYRRPAGVQQDDYTQASLWVMNADGTGITRLLAQGAYSWSQQGHAEWSPDGTKIAMFGSVGATLQIFVTNSTGGQPVQYTNQPGINTDVSWSPDGTKLLFNGCPSTPAPCTSEANYEIFVMSATAPLGTPTRLTFDDLADYDPYFSPSGSSIAWLTTTDPAANSGAGAWNIRLASVNSTSPMTLSTPVVLIPNDTQINSKPAWSLDGTTIYFHRMDLTQEPVFGVFSVNSSTGLRRLTLVGTGVNEFPSNY